MQNTYREDSFSNRRETRMAAQGVNAINLTWLLRLRWVAICGQVLTVVAVETLLGIGLPWLPLLGIVGFEAASNLAGAAWARRATDIAEWPIGLLMALDVLLLTALLYLTGGPFNPFTVLYLINIALAAVVLPPSWSWGLSLLSILSFGLLFLIEGPWTETMPHAAHDAHMSMHLQGMWVAFAVAAGFIVYFVQHVTRALAAREAELERARAGAARHEKLASLATLAAGAAHQLATPLSTIAVVAKELEQQLARAHASEETTGDARLIREQVERCREILVQMAADAGETAGEAIVTVGIERLVELAVNGLPSSGAVVVRVENLAAGRTIVAPVRSVGQALRAVVRNALDASRTDRPVVFRISADDSTWRFEVRDRGAGMPPDVLRRAGEPFFTTKGPGEGMGLGLFLARTVFERLGGNLDLRSAPGGTTAVLTLPANPTAAIRSDGRGGEGGERR
jgi:two-component system sensor histidine kinase RegB